MSKWMNGAPRRQNLSGARFLQTLPHYCPSLALPLLLPWLLPFFILKLTASNIPTQGLSSKRSDRHRGKLLSSGLEISILPRKRCNCMFIVRRTTLIREKVTWSRLMRRKMIAQFTKLLHVIPLGWLILLLGLLLINSGWTLFGEPCGYEAGEIPNQLFFAWRKLYLYQ